METLDARPQALDRMFLALGDPSRRGMIDHLSHGPATATQLAGPQGLRLPSAVKHLQVLEQGGLVVSDKAGRIRTYRLRTAALRTIADWARDRETAWHAAFDRLAAVMQEIPEEEPPP